MKNDEKKQDSFINGLILIDDFITVEEENYLMDEVNKMTWENELQRRVQQYGYKYNYKTQSIYKEDYLGKLPQFCDFLLERIKEKKIVNIDYDQMIVNEYVPGQGISPHIDKINLFDDGILSLSLGSDITMNFTNSNDKTEIKSILLKRRSLLCLKNDARYKWKHSIFKRLYDIIKGKKVKRELRVSLTFRKVKAI